MRFAVVNGLLNRDGRVQISRRFDLIFRGCLGSLLGASVVLFCFLVIFEHGSLSGFLFVGCCFCGQTASGHKILLKGLNQPFGGMGRLI